MAYIETDCTIEHEGHKFESGGAVVTETYIIAYPGANGVLNDWHGKPLGTWRAVASWPTPRSFVASRMYQIEARVGGVTYTGRGTGEGMVYKGRVKRTAR